MTLDDQEIRFCTSADGVRLAYAKVGAGPPLVKAANWLSHLEYDWNSPVWRHWLKGLSRHHTLVRYDERGCGLSDWEVEEFNLEAWVRDLEAVVEAAGLERFPLLGISQGGPIAITYAARHPERVSHLILYGSYARGRSHLDHSQHDPEEAALQLQLVKVGWGKRHPAFRQVFTSLFIPEGTTEQFHWFNELQRHSSSPENAARMLAAFHELDVREVAPKLNLPTLVLHAKGDLRVPFAEGRMLAALIPGARLVPLESRNHILLAGEPAWARFLSEVRSFLGVPNEPTGDSARTTKPAPNATTHGPSDERWRLVCDIFDRAVALPPDAREDLLAEECAGDETLRAEVESLLASDSGPSVTEKVGRALRGSILSWSSTSAPETPAGSLLAHYEVLEKLGEGGMGLVLRARDTRLGRQAALKLLPHYLGADVEIRQRFLREARAAASLDHPNVCPVYEVGETDGGQLFIAMPCYEGETLKEKIARGPLPLDEALDYTAQAAEGLAHAHESAVVHRDIKPANLIVTSRGRLKILDFGIAKVADTDVTRSGLVLGTVAYMSPEQATGAAIDHRTDLWSLGVVLFEMLAGRQPFAGDSSPAILRAIQYDDPPRLKVLRPDVPEPVCAIVSRLLLKEPSRRFQQAEELLAALRQIGNAA